MGKTPFKSLVGTISKTQVDDVRNSVQLLSNSITLNKILGCGV